MDTIKLTIQKDDTLMKQLLIGTLESMKQFEYKTFGDYDLTRIYDTVIEKVKKAGNRMDEHVFTVELFGGQIDITKNSLKRAVKNLTVLRDLAIPEGADTDISTSRCHTLLLSLYAQIESQQGILNKTSAISKKAAKTVLQDTGLDNEYMPMGIPLLRHYVAKELAVDLRDDIRLFTSEMANRIQAAFCL